jgi:hypothetical protein
MPISLSGSLNLSGSLTTTGTITATTLVVQTITSSISSITGSTNFGSLSSNTHTFTGSMFISSSAAYALDVTGGGRFSDTIVAAKPGGNLRISGSIDGGVFTSGVNILLSDWATATKGLTINLLTGSAIFSNTLAISRSVVMTTQSDYGYQNIIINSGFGSGYTGAKIQSLLAGYDGTLYGTDIGYSYDGGGAGNTGYSLRFSTNDDLSGNPIERMRINSTGSVGIGDSTTAISVVRLRVKGIDQSSSNYTFNTVDSTAADTMWIRNDGLTYLKGNVLVNRTSDAGASYKLQVEGNFYIGGGSKIQFNTSNTMADSIADFYNVSSTGYGLYIKAAGNSSAYYALNINNYAGTALFNVAGNGLVTVNYLAGVNNRTVYSDASGNLTNSSSDVTLKKNVENITYGLNSIMSLKPVSYNWIPENLGIQKEIGFIAQEVQSIIPEVIGINNDKTLSLDYPKLTAVLVKAIQELTARVQYLENK